MITFYVDQEGSLWNYDYKEEVAGDQFDELFVLTGNRNYRGCEEASWWEKAKEVLHDLDTDEFPGAVFMYYPELSRQQRKAILKVYDETVYSDDMDTIVKVANILYPEREFDTTTIRGYCQGDWQEVAYDTRAEYLLERLEAWYFGMVSEVSVGECYAGIPNNDLWRWEKEGRLKKELLDYFDYAPEAECEVYISDGYTQTKKWKLTA